MLTERDHINLLAIPDKVINGYNGNSKDIITRARIENATESMIKFFMENESRINAKLVIVRTKDDEGMAAKYRNAGQDTLFVFGQKYAVTPYFSGTTELVIFPKALLSRAAKQDLIYANANATSS